MFEDFLKRLLRGYNGVVSALAADLAREFSSGKYRGKCFARFFFCVLTQMNGQTVHARQVVLIVLQRDPLRQNVAAALISGP